MHWPYFQKFKESILHISEVLQSYDRASVRLELVSYQLFVYIIKTDDFFLTYRNSICHFFFFCNFVIKFWVVLFSHFSIPTICKIPCAHWFLSFLSSFGRKELKSVLFHTDFIMKQKCFHFSFHCSWFFF